MDKYFDVNGLWSMQLANNVSVLEEVTNKNSLGLQLPTRGSGLRMVDQVNVIQCVSVRLRSVSDGDKGTVISTIFRTLTLLAIPCIIRLNCKVYA